MYVCTVLPLHHRSPIIGIRPRRKKTSRVQLTCKRNKRKPTPGPLPPKKHRKKKTFPIQGVCLVIDRASADGMTRRTISAATATAAPGLVALLPLHVVLLLKLSIDGVNCQEIEALGRHGDNTHF